MGTNNRITRISGKARIAAAAAAVVVTAVFAAILLRNAVLE